MLERPDQHLTEQLAQRQLVGTKIDANANRHATMDWQQIAAEIIDDARAIDTAEDELSVRLAGMSSRRSWSHVRGGVAGCAMHSNAWATPRGASATDPGTSPGQVAGGKEAPGGTAGSPEAGQRGV